MIKLRTLLSNSIVLFIVISCGQQSAVKEKTADPVAQNESVAVESSAVAPEPEVAEELPEPDEPPIESSALTAPHFDFFKATITDNPVEDSTVNALGRIIREFNTQGFVTIMMIDKHGDPVTGGIAKNEDIFYYNAERQLCASSKTYKSDRTTEDSNYLFNGDDLVAMTLDSDFYDEGAGYTTSVRIASTPECRGCGVKITNDDGDGDEISEIGSYEYENDFFNGYDNMLKSFQEVTELTRQGERYTALIISESSSVTADTIKYSIDPNLVHRFFKKAVIRD